VLVFYRFLSDMFTIKNGIKEGDALLALFSTLL